MIKGFTKCVLVLISRYTQNLQTIPLWVSSSKDEQCWEQRSVSTPSVLVSRASLSPHVGVARGWPARLHQCHTRMCTAPTPNYAFARASWASSACAWGAAGPSLALFERLNYYCANKLGSCIILDPVKRRRP